MMGDWAQHSGSIDEDQDRDDVDKMGECILVKPTSDAIATVGFVLLLATTAFRFIVIMLVWETHQIWDPQVF